MLMLDCVCLRWFDEEEREGKMNPPDRVAGSAKIFQVQ